MNKRWERRENNPTRTATPISGGWPRFRSSSAMAGCSRGGSDAEVHLFRPDVIGDSGGTQMGQGCQTRFPSPARDRRRSRSSKSKETNVRCEGPRTKSPASDSCAREARKKGRVEKVTGKRSAPRGTPMNCPRSPVCAQSKLRVYVRGRASEVYARPRRRGMDTRSRTKQTDSGCWQQQCNGILERKFARRNIFCHNKNVACDTVVCK